MAVLIQEMVRADASAVVFSANPATSNKGEILINSTWGLCESIVSGMSTPDSYVLNKDTKNLIDSDIAEKTTMTVPVGDGIQIVDVPTQLRCQPSLNNHQLTEIANLAMSLESKMGCPVDIECSYSLDNLYLLQCRPITGMS
jgi:pyruvate,water dikinase